MQLSRVDPSYQRPKLSTVFLANFRTIIISFLVLILFGVCSKALAQMYYEVLETKDRTRRFEI